MFYNFTYTVAILAPNGKPWLYLSPNYDDPAPAFERLRLEQSQRPEKLGVVRTSFDLLDDTALIQEISNGIAT